MGTSSQCEGLMRIRERIVFNASSNIHKSDNDVTHMSHGHVTCLSDNVWYFCVLRASCPKLEWFSVDAETENSDEANVLPQLQNSDNALLLATTSVSSVEAVDGENVMLPGDLTADPQERNRLECCSFYVKNVISNVALLIEAETQTQRDQWVQNLRDLLLKEETLKEDMVQDLNSLDLSASGSSVSMRSLLHQGKSEKLMEEGDPFGLLSLTTSALSSFESSTSNAAPGMFAMDHFEMTEGGGRTKEVEDTDESGDKADFDFDCAADTAGNPSLSLSLERVPSGEIMDCRDRFHSNATDPLSSSVFHDSAITTKNRRHSVGSVIGSSSRPIHGCLRCNKRFGRFIHTPKICASCSHRFCRDHCSQKTAITNSESITVPSGDTTQEGTKGSPAAEMKRVCMDCYVRQQLLTSLQEAGAYYASAIDEAGGLSRLVRWKYFDQGPKHKIEAYVCARSLGPLSLLSAMYKYRQQSFMFVVVLAQLVHIVENCLDTMDFYWPQFLQWGFVNLPDASPSARAFYLFFLAATARRSVHLAVKATWECIAAHWDAMAEGHYKRGNEIIVMLFFVTNINFGEPRSVLPQLLFSRAPRHQRESLDRLLEQLYEYVRRVYAASHRESPFFEWLLARSKEEVVVSSRNVQKQLRGAAGFLDPFPTDYHEEAQLMILERRRSGTQHLIETKQRMWNKAAQHIFCDEVRLVRFLVDLCTFLKEHIPEPSQRRKQLPALLQEMLRGKHIRPEAALPLSGAMGSSHRVVNVLTDEGTVFSTRARAPTLIYFEIIESSMGSDCDHHELDIPVRDSNLDALVDSAVDEMSELDRQEIINYLDREFIATYMEDLIPVSRTTSRDSLPYSLSEDLDARNSEVQAACTPQSEKGGSDVSFDEESDSFRAEDSHGETALSVSSSSTSMTPSDAMKCPFFGERFADTRRRIREKSTFSRYEGWALVPVIAKSFDDMRQEVFVLQGLKLFQLIFRKHKLDLWMRYYSIVCVGKDCGLLEVITDSQSLDGLKKKGRSIDGIGTRLPKIFERACGRDPTSGDHDSVRLERARANFIKSMAAYSLFCYIFLVKDRHNGNIMLGTEGHVVHIDFGFVLGIAPGNTFSLETAPFKLTLEMVETMGAEGFDRYRQLVAQGLFALHLEASQLLSFVYLSSKDSCFPCFKDQSRARIVRQLSRRLCVGMSAQEVERTAARIVDKSCGHRGTRQYDWFQKISNGILP